MPEHSPDFDPQIDRYDLGDNSPGSRVSTPAETYEGYELLRQLTSGGMAESYMAKELASGNTVFLKRVRKASKEAVALQRELAIYEKLMRLNFEHVIRFGTVVERKGVAEAGGAVDLTN